MSAAVEVAAVTVTRGGRRVLDAVDLHVGAHAAVAILGPNGAGKSTLLDVVLGLRAPDGGTVRVFGAPPPARDVGLVPQEAGASLFPWLRARANVALPLRVVGASPAARERALDAVWQRVDPDRQIDPRARPLDLSGGERQRVALMRALVTRPRLLVCDEPFSAIDAPARVRLLSLLRSLREGEDAPALLLVTHDIGDAMALADEALVLGLAAPRRAVLVPIAAGARPAIEEALLCA